MTQPMISHIVCLLFGLLLGWIVALVVAKRGVEAAQRLAAMPERPQCTHLLEGVGVRCQRLLGPQGEPHRGPCRCFFAGRIYDFEPGDRVMPLRGGRFT